MIQPRVLTVAQRCEKRPPRLIQLFLELPRTIAFTARPRFASIQVAAVSARVCILDAQQVKVILPIRPLFFEWTPTEADLHPARGPIASHTCLLHVMQVLIAGDRTFAESAALNGLEQGFLPTRFHSCFNQVTHGGCKNSTRTADYTSRYAAARGYLRGRRRHGRVAVKEPKSDTVGWRIER